MRKLSDTRDRGKSAGVGMVDLLAEPASFRVVHLSTHSGPGTRKGQVWLNMSATAVILTFGTRTPLFSCCSSPPAAQSVPQVSSFSGRAVNTSGLHIPPQASGTSSAGSEEYHSAPQTHSSATPLLWTLTFS